MNSTKVLIIAAHPDDDVLGCGGYMAKYSQQKNIKVVFVAEGTTCRYSTQEAGGDAAKEALRVRTKSSTDSLELLGVRAVEFYNLPCGRLDQEPILEINQIIENEINEFQPELILTHSENDVNNDHRIVYRSVQMATRPGSFCGVDQIMSFEVLSSTEWNYEEPFKPNHFELLTEEWVEKKWKALECYESEIREFPHPRSRLGVETLARYRGMQSGIQYAEAYNIIRKIEE